MENWKNWTRRNKMDFKKICKLVFEEYKKNGYYDKWEEARLILGSHGIEGIVELAEIGLVYTELAEAMEEIRNGKHDGSVETELADTIIRIMNFASRRGMDLETALIKKHAKNMTREKYHGRKVF